MWAHKRSTAGRAASQTWRDLSIASVKVRAWRLLINLTIPARMTAGNRGRHRMLFRSCWFGLQRRTISSCGTPCIQPYRDRGPTRVRRPGLYDR